MFLIMQYFNLVIYCKSNN